KIITFSSPTEFTPLIDKRLSGFPIDIKVISNSLYVVCSENEVYKANESGLTRAIPYTTDKKISEPHIVKKFSKFKWGISGNQIYLAEDGQQDWFREKVLEFDVADFKLLSDSVAIFWDGTKNNYIYSTSNSTPKIYFPSDPIKNFLVNPITSFSVNSGSQGCYHHIGNEVKYRRISDSTFTTSSVLGNRYDEKATTAFNNKVESHLLLNVLNSINSNPYAIPSLKDFKITDMDKKNFLDLVDKQLESKEIDYGNRKKKINKEFYYSVPAILDTLNDSIIANILDQRERVWSTTSNWFTIQVVNQNHDTLNISRNYYVNKMPWNLPWEYEYKGLYFNCYNVDFSKLINFCIPENFMDKEVFDNRFLIMHIADYLYNKP
ncbi:MAG TPA: hypothetical protein VF691_20490, partial [Cytophagaceae bacterium]